MDRRQQLQPTLLEGYFYNVIFMATRLAEECNVNGSLVGSTTTIKAGLDYLSFTMCGWLFLLSTTTWRVLNRIDISYSYEHAVQEMVLQVISCSPGILLGIRRRHGCQCT